MRPVEKQREEHAIGEQGEAIYGRHSGELERSSLGLVVAIDIDTGDLFVGGDVMEADAKAQAAHPNKQFYFRWIGTRRLPDRATRS